MKPFNYAPAIVALLLLTSCAQPPTEQLDAADKAVREVQQSGASTYVPQDYAKLEGMLTSARKEIEEQNAKFALLRDYGKADQLAASAKAEAGRLKIEADKRKEEARQAASQAQLVAQDAVKATQALVAKAPIGKDRAALEAIKADAQALTVSLAEIQTAIDSGDYLSAQAKAKAIHDKSQSVSAEIQTALAKTKGGKSQNAQGKKRR